MPGTHDSILDETVSERIAAGHFGAHSPGIR